jgi:hypothetical protein
VALGDNDLEGIRQIKAAREDALLALPGVVGVDIGFKEVGGRRTDEVAIRVLVETKRNVPEEERVPDSLEEFRTDVIQRGRITFMVDLSKYDPLIGGISIGACGGPPGTGTLGAIVRDLATGQLMALSNWHVLVYGVSGTINVAQPGPFDGGICPSDVFGQVTRSAINDFVDCAVATITSRTAKAAIAEYGFIAGTTSAQVGDRVRKRGRTSGMTWGDVDTTDATVTIRDFAGTTRTFKNQIGIWRADGVSNWFIQRGDSGSVVFHPSNSRVSGLAFAGSTGNPFLPDGAYAYANPIGAVMAALNVQIATPPKTKEGKDGKEKDKDNLREKLRKEIDNLAGLAYEDLPAGAFASTAAGSGPLRERLERLEANVEVLHHFIDSTLRPPVGGDFRDDKSTE